jgi:hypothetical protein
MSTIVANVISIQQQRGLNLNIPTDDKYAFFKKMVDELVDFGQYDPDLKEGLEWLDNKAREQGCSFYDMVFQVLGNYDQNARVKKWVRDRDD